MSFITQLIAFGLRQVIGDCADDVAQVVGVVERRFRDHSRKLPKALENAHNRAWQALGVALAGDGLVDRIKVFFASGDDKGVREQVQVFVKSDAVSFDGTPAEFRQACLDELKRLRKSGLLSASGGSAADIARQAAGFKRHTDPQGLIEESRRAVDGVADALAGAYPNLSRLLRTPTPSGPPLLAAAFCYFFRREVETDDELAHGLFFDGLRQLSASQAKAFGEVGKALAALGGQFDALFEQLGRIEAAVEETHAVAVETHGAVLDMQAELQRLGCLHLADAGEIRSLLEQVLLHLGQVGMTRGEVRPANSCSIRGEDERRAVKALLERFRRLPAEEQRKAPALLNGLGKLQVGAGDFAEARQTFTEVVQVVGDPSDKAEASYNAYRAALEEKKWDAALAALREAASHDPQRFAPFPLHRYEPKRILGAGGFGTAILCHDRNFDEEVVVKALHAADLERGVDDVFGEARILRRLSHPAIIGVRDCEYANPADKARPYLVMDYFPGGTLQQFVEERGPLGLEQLLALAVQVAEGMKAAHAQGVLHRDLKPANLLVRKEGDLWRAKIIDFGLALRQQTLETSRVRTGATQKSMLDSSVAGTLDYAPPEQLGKVPGVLPGPYSDAYAFARTCCYAMFTATEPRRKQWDSLPRRLADLLECCLDPDPRQRPRGFEPVLVVLAECSLEREEAGRLGQQGPPPQRKPGDVYTNSLGMKFVWIPPGAFLMGSPKKEAEREGYQGADETQHEVTLTKGFHLGIHQVTQAQWQAVMGSNPSHFKGDYLPVEQISWDDAVAFCAALSEKDGKKYRLPTEAEWEYACRAGTTTPFHFGTTPATAQANYDGNYTYGKGKKGVYRRKTTLVGSFPPNDWGLYDMHGNVWEWCADWYGEYEKGSINDPKGLIQGETRVVRGGSWRYNPRNCRSACRSRFPPAYRDNLIGLRVCLLLD
ncbi:MAG TPA: bifunctional serine/threonine-protein kinase/formylglycine-generating enzyme family protein [Gemmataceae bacterium]|nr:bifunctional serine/threonine-protein kinase/formylglycine-generating enzyme family protein [Gemmataceae bacterium]